MVFEVPHGPSTRCILHFKYRQTKNLGNRYPDGSVHVMGLVELQRGIDGVQFGYHFGYDNRFGHKYAANISRCVHGRVYLIII
jgi:hypothetical protein